MIEKSKTIAVLPILGAILIIISLFTPFALSWGLEGVSISSQSDVWYWGIYQSDVGYLGTLPGQTFSLNLPVLIILPIIILIFAILIVILSIEFGLNRINRKLYGELIFIYIVLIYLSITLTTTLIEYAFSLMPDLQPVMFTGAPFWSYRFRGFGEYGINFAFILVVVGSIISLKESSEKSFFTVEILFVVFWILFNGFSSLFFF